MFVLCYIKLRFFFFLVFFKSAPLKGKNKSDINIKIIHYIARVYPGVITSEKNIFNFFFIIPLGDFLQYGSKSVFFLHLISSRVCSYLVVASSSQPYLFI